MCIMSVSHGVSVGKMEGELQATHAWPCSGHGWQGDWEAEGPRSWKDRAKDRHDVGWSLRELEGGNVP